MRVAGIVVAVFGALVVALAALYSMPDLRYLLLECDATAMWDSPCQDHKLHLASTAKRAGVGVALVVGGLVVTVVSRRLQGSRTYPSSAQGTPQS